MSRFCGMQLMVYSAADRSTAALSPANLLSQLAESRASGCLTILSQDVSWIFYLHNGNLFYGITSIDPFDCLERNLKAFSAEIPNIDRPIRQQIRSLFEKQEGSNSTAVYQALSWLRSEGFINQFQTDLLIKNLIKETLESFLSLQTASHRFLALDPSLPILTEFTVFPLLDETFQRLREWSGLSEKVYSPFQRPYLFSQSTSNNKFSPEKLQKLGNLLKGYSLRHLAALIHQDEIKLMRSLDPYIQEGVVFFREPQPPFDKLPPLLRSDLISGNTAIAGPVDTSNNLTSSPSATARPVKIVCIDDSPIILSELRRFLDEDRFEVITIIDSVKALMEVMRIEPDLILLDVGMPNVDGYKFCKVVRNHPNFKTTPIIMVTGNTGLIDRAKAKMSGATDYLTKPFTQEGLLNIVNQHLHK
ncbi:response regulator [Synechococcus elongatus PCC 6311]|uniref:Response regulator receiver domain protein (CheY-like) n=2 Tax=Synechococcus elongatus TaxID=32046 RepID=Q31PY4_SYNE7|nr:response regulator receiver domain protein (CheY-like) [Synechococcus elongatus PCC 7942 = FACHB-805]AJD58587.1 chemotaxis protein CheY [Synechococcus elongatus UTEX 2973]MBD2588759.1 response regulator [Synechococcus elongatus FACHB-242]MBD2689653.1 response regulator [Synechococcus elongatus FACHB-1061]UOW70657.1 response regulator [Synechococcus elongatus PCC 7943]UOW73378.1 response regulator [Synechococcus elongatus PCC 6311]UOW76098.1 response regulator [Synechococcus elongatus PCC 6